jgi:hypothetical protein
VTNKPSQRKSFTALVSAKDEARGSPNFSTLDRSLEAGSGANGAPDEFTTVERRLLAHERILQSLVGHLAEDDPEILVQLKRRFGSGHNIGQYEQDFVSTDHYGDHFIRAVEDEVMRRKQADPQRSSEK